MDQDKISFFISRYKTLDGDELTELHSKRDSLVEEAVVALDTVLSDKGINKDILAIYSPKPAQAVEPSGAELGLELWNGKLAMSCKLAFVMLAWSPLSHALTRSGINLSGIFLGLLVAALGFAGFRIGHAVTKAIALSENASLSEKKRSLWILLVASIVLYFVLFVAAESIANSPK